MNGLIAHRGPDGQSAWIHPSGRMGLAHSRLSIIDLETGNQPMTDEGGNCIVFNGEIYNFIELREELGSQLFVTASDTEVILRAYRKWGRKCVDRLRGMFAFALWDEERGELFCARDRFGIKPFYYFSDSEAFYFASEIKALLPFMDSVEVNEEGLRDYFVFQFCLDGKTLFKDVRELPPAHILSARDGGVRVERYWEVYYDIDFQHTDLYFTEKLRELLEESVRLHLRSDVPVGAYISGGIDSSSLAAIGARDRKNEEFFGFTGAFRGFDGAYDETHFARRLADAEGIRLFEVDITSEDFKNHIREVIYHLDFPVAGPGAFPQFMVSREAARHRKVVLGGQGGDEIFGGYARYLIAYFEQCIKGAMEGTLGDGNFVVTYESIIPNLTALRNYKPLMREFFAQGMFDSLDRRYFHLINRAPTLRDEIRWESFSGAYDPFESFLGVFNGKNVGKQSYFDRMTHFDFKTLLPALLQVEDRMSMASGLESRVPLLDHKIVEFAATIPADIKFKAGTMKRLYINAVRDLLPKEILDRKDKMGFPVPLGEWISGELGPFVREVFQAQKERGRPYFATDRILSSVGKEPRFGRKIWGLLSLELWFQEFIDKGSAIKWKE